jgi:hypothetical protein
MRLLDRLLHPRGRAVCTPCDVNQHQVEDIRDRYDTEEPAVQVQIIVLQAQMAACRRAGHYRTEKP